MLIGYRWLSPLIGLLLSLMTSAQAGVISIIIDDIGYNHRLGLKAIQLDANITLAILPDAPFAKPLSDIALQSGHEIMLHIPMQPTTPQTTHEPVVLNVNMDKIEVQAIVDHYLDAFPQARGINNHMGSLLTRHPGHMSWIMADLSEHPGTYFVDSRTHRNSIASKIASEYGIANTTRDIFLDAEPATPKAIRFQIQRMTKQLEKEGFVLAIGHPHAETLKALRQAIPKLLAAGHTIVPVSRYIELKESLPCPTCSSPSLRVVKN